MNPQRKKILVAEDDIFLVNVYKAKLLQENFDFQIATDGDEALRLMKEYRPDLLILDLVMRGKDGFKVLEMIKLDPSLKDVIILVASNLGQKEDINKCIALGASDYIIKSDVTLAAIITKVKSLLNIG
jgi:two-component system phosphate regulon response regulator PhoB/two-component system alkaline phosphatase synthesis response regulator PhoP